MRLKKSSKRLRVCLLAPVATFLVGCNSALLDPKGQIAIEQRSLILTAFALMLIVVVPAILMALIFAWKYRASNLNAKYSPNWCHSNKVEVVVWTIPILIIVFLAILTWKSTHALEQSKPLVSDVEPIEIDVIALDWKWAFIYPKQGIATVNQIAFPVGTPINFRVTSNTVMNSFFIPTLGSQIYAMAGMQTKLHLIANKAGTFDGISANYSGRGFSGMKFKALAMATQEDFEQWVSTVKHSSNTLLDMDDFEKLAVPSENNPVQYFSHANPNLFNAVIQKFMNHEKTHISQGESAMSRHKKEKTFPFSEADIKDILHESPVQQDGTLDISFNYSERQKLRGTSEYVAASKQNCVLDRKNLFIQRTQLERQGV